MRPQQIRNDKTSSKRWLALTLILFVVAATAISGYNGASILPMAQAKEEDRQLQPGSQTELPPSISNLLSWQTTPAPHLPPVNRGGGGKQGGGQQFEIFNLDTFEANLKAALDSKTVGYSYAIYEFNQLKRAGAGGYAFVPSTQQSPDKRMTVMSMSKTITATGVMKAMEEMKAQGKQISIDSKIAPYLPSEWHLGPHVKELTFRQLLTHTGGLRPATGDPDSYLGLKQTIAQGAQDADIGKFFYANADFCLFRIIIPYMIMSKAEVKNIENMSWQDRALTLGQTYVSYIKQQVLANAGLTGVDVVPTGPKPFVRYYKFGDTSAFATDPTDDTAVLRTGAGYWFMSVKEYGQFIASLRNARILSPDTYKMMKDNNLGMYGVDSKFGTYWDHNGGFPPVSNGSGAMADWMAFPNGITAVILVNSKGGTTKAPQDIVRDAFNTAW